MRAMVWIAGGMVVLGLAGVVGAMVSSGSAEEPVLPVTPLRRADLAEMAPPLTALHPHPTHDDWLLATGPHRVAFVTRTRGRSWEPVLLHEPWPGRDLAVPDAVRGWDEAGWLVVLEGDEVHISDDGGLTFGEAVGVDEVLPGAQHFETERGAWRLREGTPEFRPVGTSRFEARTTGIERPVPVSVVSHPKEPTHVAMVDSAGQLWTTPDFGDRWRRAPVESAQQALFVEGSEGAWLVRTGTLELAWVDDEREPLGPDPAELPRLVVPPYLDHPRDPGHQQRMLARMMRRPTVEEAGLREDGALWVHVAGIDATRDRWIRDPTGRWTSEERPPDAHAVAAWGESARTSCRVALQGSAAFVRDTPVPLPEPPHGHPLAVGFLTDDVLYVVAERGVHFRTVGAGCEPGEARGAWRWEEPALSRALAWARGDTLRVLGFGAEGVWRQRFELRSD